MRIWRASCSALAPPLSKPGKQTHLELGLDAADLLLAEAAIGGAQELVAHHAEKLRGAVRPASRVNREHAGVGKA